MWSIIAEPEAFARICIPLRHRSKTLAKNEVQTMLGQGILQGKGPHATERHKYQAVLEQDQIILSISSSRLQALLSLLISRPHRHLSHFSVAPFPCSFQPINQDEVSRYYHVIQRVGRSCSGCGCTGCDYHHQIQQRDGYED